MPPEQVERQGLLPLVLGVLVEKELVAEVVERQLTPVVLVQTQQLLITPFMHITILTHPIRILLIS